MGVVNDFVLGTKSPIGQFTQTYAQLDPLRQTITTNRVNKAEAVRQKEYNSLFNAAVDSRDPETWAQLVRRTPPQELERFQQAWGGMTGQEQQQNITQMSELVTAFDSGATDIGYAKLSDYAEALEAEGDTEGANGIRNLIHKGKTTENGERIITGYLTQKLAGMPGSEETLNRILSVNKDERDEKVTDAGLLKIANDLAFSSEEERQRAMSVADKYGEQTAKLLLELSSVRDMAGGSGGWKDTDEFYKAEMALRKEYDNFVEPFNTVVNNATIIEGLSAQGTGFSDQSMIMAFNKVLDPNSVVRESEARMTADNQSAVNKGRTILASLAEGERLSPEAREELLNAVKLMSEFAQEEIAVEHNRIQKSVEHFKFGEERIFASDLPKETDTAANAQNKIPQIVVDTPEEQAVIDQKIAGAVEVDW